MIGVARIYSIDTLLFESHSLNDSTVFSVVNISCAPIYNDVGTDGL